MFGEIIRFWWYKCKRYLCIIFIVIIWFYILIILLDLILKVLGNVRIVENILVSNSLIYYLCYL